jgi:hypothetical protein
MSLMNEFSGGSENRYRHAFNPRFIYTEGVREAAKLAGAFWLLDIMALKMAPLYHAAWMKGNASVGIVTLEVYSPENRPLGAEAKVVLSLEDDAPNAYEELIPCTDFPEGNWNFYFGTDQVGPEDYVTTVCLPQEY